MKTLIIAEAGVNHNGDLALAKKMAVVAKNAGADIVKYQTAVPELVISKFAEKAEYQKVQTGDHETQLEMVRRIHFGFEAHRELKAYCDSIGIQYLSAAFDLPSIDFLASLDLPLFKIPSGEITNLPYLERVAACRKPVLLSTGMSEMEEIAAALNALKLGGAGEVTVLHCNTEYPTPAEDANLRALLDIKKRFGCRVGYSDHTLGIEADVAAVALGAEVVEKHFTLDKNMEGPDHKASLSPSELMEMCIRDRIADGMYKAFFTTKLTMLGSGFAVVLVILALLALAYLCGSRAQKARTAWFAALSMLGFAAFYVCLLYTSRCV